jgi:hypothetical protein
MVHSRKQKAGCPVKTKSILVTLVLVLSFALNTLAATRYVDVNGAHPAPPYTDWSTAATNIQDAVDVAASGDLVLVTNGVYAAGGRRWFDSGTNRVTLTNAVTLQSVNGPAVTLIVGHRVAGTGLALTNAARCVAIGDSAVLSGFTLTNGQAGWGNYPNGGGVAQVRSLSVAGVVTNCVLINNLSTNGAGGGAYRVRLINCQIIGNYAGYGGGACGSTLLDCTVASNTANYGGGVYGSTTLGASLATNCTFVRNSSSTAGGGAHGSTLVNCVLSGNSGGQNGGGAYGGSLNQCLVVSNNASAGGGASESTLRNSLVAGNSALTGGGAYNITMTNCTVVSNRATNSSGGIGAGGGAWAFNSIICSNTAPAGSNYIGAKCDYCCIWPEVVIGNSTGITNEPGFLNPAAGNYRLQSNSPCINAGKNYYVIGATDLDGQPRIQGGTVDIGACEYQTPASMLSYAWAQQYGLPTDGSADLLDPDGDHHNNWQEWRASTVPTNAASVLQMVAPSNTVSGLRVSWQSSAGVTYFLERSTNLVSPPAFTAVRSNLLGQAGTTSFTDTNATGPGPFFYRVGVQ